MSVLVRDNTDHQQTPLVFVGHSMGGLVIKRAYILAKQKEVFHKLAERVKAILFLATPHRGADLAHLLSRILNLTSGSRPFVADLHRNSVATQSINDEFPQHCQDLQLYSFYETLPTNYGVGKGLIVDKDLATLGYANERTAYLNANHREVCKYSAQSDSNYQTVRNALASSIDSFRSRASDSCRGLDNEQQRLLDSYLGVSEAPENELMRIDTVRMRGSCEWLLHKQSFQEWRDSGNTQLYWISAKPAAGKTILSGSIIHHIKDLDRDLAFYFLDYRHKAKTTINSLLLSLAWQMAHTYTEVSDNILTICEKDEELKKADYRTIWRKLFVEGVLRTKYLRPQYWVIDALDECKQNSELVGLLLKVVETSPIRVLVTSREHFEPRRHALRPGLKVHSEAIEENDTKSDIALYIEANMDQLPRIDDEARQDMIEKILNKSAGCFLWVSLTLQELKGVHTSAEIRQVLEDVPSDMDELYSRIVATMASATYGKKLAKAILTWTTCSVRPLTTDELHCALQLDLKDSIDNLERSVNSSCGQLVYVDAQSRVQMVHQTARDFLLRNAGITEFAVDGKAGHKTLAMTCLQYLNGTEMKGPKHRRLSATNAVKQRCPFVTYACGSFFEHIAHVSSTDDDIFHATVKFLKSSNVLSWIEYTAQSSDLHPLLQAGKVLKKFLQRRSTHVSPLGRDVAILDSWSVDLPRLTTKFGQNLLTSPSSVFQLIPPFCPPQSAPRKQFAASTRGIAVLGLSATDWDDCMSTIVDAEERFLSLACSDAYFAIGMSSGKIAIYHGMTCQESQTLRHHEPVRFLQFGRTMSVLASVSLKKARIWDTHMWEQLWEIDLPHMTLSMLFMEEQQLLLVALKNNLLMVWDIMSGNLRDTADWTTGLEGPDAHGYRRPIAAAFNGEACLLAIVYRGQDILLWDLERDSLHETYCKESGARAPGEQRANTPGAIGLIFCLAPSSYLLAVSYADGDLALFDTSEGSLLGTTLANAQTLASSPDGRMLAGGNSSGVIQLFEFETLKLLYRIDSDEYGVQELAYSRDGHRLLDIRGSQCRVWDPTVLLREDIDEENSDTVSISTAAQDFKSECSQDIVLITSLCCHAADDLFFVGKEDGSVYVYEAKTGQLCRRVLSHASGVAVLSLYLEQQSQLLISIDSSSRIMAHRLLPQQSREVDTIVFEHREGIAVSQVLSNKECTRFLVCTLNQDTLWSLGESGNTILNVLLWQDRAPSRWLSHPVNHELIILITNNTAHLYHWESLQRQTDPQGILLEGSILPELAIRSITSCSDGAFIATTFATTSKSGSQARLLLWNSSDFQVVVKSAAPVPKYRSLASQVQNIVGEYGRRLVFLHSKGWICSANLLSSSVDNYDRHFFLPADWLSTGRDLLISITCNGDIVVVKRDEVAVIKRGLDNIEPDLGAPGKRPSLLVGRPRSSLAVPEA